MPTPKRPRGRPKGSKNKGAAKTRVRLEEGPLPTTAAIGGLGKGRLVLVLGTLFFSGIWGTMCLC